MQRLVLIILLVFCVTAPAASAEQRVALVIGNSNYADAPLLNPANDARLIAATLRQLGFEVTERLDADENTMERAIQDFGDRLEDIGKEAVGLFYYAGHGAQLDGVNYLIPIGAEIDRERRIKSEAVSTTVVLDAFEFARNELNFLILDACRNNPYARGTRSAQRGLARMDAPAGTLIAYATAPGFVAYDGEDENSPYSSALATAMQQKGVPVEQMLKNVRRSVMAETGGAQTPWEASSLVGDFYFNEVSAASDSPIDTVISDANFERENRFWRGIQDSGVIEYFKEYLRQFPQGTFAELARLRIAELRNSESTESAQGSRQREAPDANRSFDSSVADIRTRNTAERVAERSWQWSAFIEAAPETIDHVVCVEYTLHETFSPRVRTICDRGSPAEPYALRTAGWGTFKLKLRVVFDDGSSRQLEHQLSFSSP